MTISSHFYPGAGDGLSQLHGELHRTASDGLGMRSVKPAMGSRMYIRICIYINAYIRNYIRILHRVEG